MKKAASAWVAALTWSQPAFSRIAAIPRALEKAQISPRSLRIFKSFGFPIYPINNALGVASNEVLFGRISTYFGKAGFQIFHAIQGFLEAPFLGFTKLLNIFL
jgi:hypothetical protein